MSVIAGEGDGPLITIDAHGHIHITPDPRPEVDEAIRGELLAAAEELAGGARSFAAAIGRLSAGAPVG